MKTPGIAIALFIIIVASVSARLNQDSKSQTLSSEILTQSSVTPSPTPASISTSTPSPTKAEDSSKKTSTALSNFFYPGAKVLAETETSASLESTEDTGKITDWYKGKIEAMGMNVKSFIVTRANDKVLNKLSGANGAREINIEISKERGVSPVIISVNLKNF